MTTRKTRFLAACLLFLLTVGTSASSNAANDPWATLARVRDAWAKGGAEQGTFRQTYTPAGFSSGETERGRVTLMVPDCLRWDYEDPEPKSFLLCGGDVYSWIPGESQGRHATFDPRREPGLDLLLLPLDDLRSRYEATLGDAGAHGAGTGPSIALRPLNTATTSESATGPAATLRAASLVLDPAGRRLLQLLYTDLDGNQTRFELADWRPTSDRSLFDPPTGIEWSED